MISVRKFLGRIAYKPIFVGKALDGVVIVTWKEIDGCTPSLEFGTTVRKGRQYFYYEIVDFGHGYKDGEVIPLDDRNRRKDVYNGYINADTFDELCAMVNRSLKAFFHKSEECSIVFVEKDGINYEVDDADLLEMISDAIENGRIRKVS